MRFKDLFGSIRKGEGMIKRKKDIDFFLITNDEV